MARTSKKSMALVAVLCLAILVMPACTGPFNLTRSLHDWNRSFENDWAEEGMFLVLVILPVYGICMLGDAIIFNSIEFWTGDNPIDGPGPSVDLLPAEGSSTELVAVADDGSSTLR